MATPPPYCYHHLVPERESREHSIHEIRQSHHDGSTSRSLTGALYPTRPSGRREQAQGGLRGGAGRKRYDKIASSGQLPAPYEYSTVHQAREAIALFLASFQHVHHAME